jgi:FkbM family methyltransferase
LGYGGKIVSFEPSPDAFAVLKTKLDENWLAFQLGLGSSEGILELNIDPNSVMNSFLKPKNPHATKKISVKVVRLDSMVDEILRLTKANSLFLKCDTQGFDTEVVTGAGHFAESLKGLMSEVSVQPLYENMTDYTDAIISYQKMGFKLHSLHPVTIDKQGCIVEYNCMMTRPN